MIETNDIEYKRFWDMFDKKPRPSYNEERPYFANMKISGNGEMVYNNYALPEDYKEVSDELDNKEVF